MKYLNCRIFDEIQDEIREFLDQDYYFFGQASEDFQVAFAKFSGVKYFLGTSSGTTALQLLLRSLDLPQGSKVLVSAFTPLPTPMAILEAGLIPHFVDINPKTLTLSMQSLQDEVDENCKVILPVHIFGKVSDMPAIHDFAKSQNLFVIEDACQAAGSRGEGFGLAEKSYGAAMSFYPTKNLGGWGDGGGVLTNDSQCKKRIFQMRNYGLDDNFVSTYIGGNYRLDDLQALVLLKKLQTLPEHNASQNAFVSRCKAILPNEGFQSISSGEEHNYHVVSYLLPESGKLIGEIRKLYASKNLRTSFFYDSPVYDHKALRCFKSRPLPITEDICSRIINLKNDPELLEEIAHLLRGR
jgi:dTDP-4-amino-4,6-dideoxygalactose transaminase